MRRLAILILALVMVSLFCYGVEAAEEKERVYSLKLSTVLVDTDPIAVGLLLLAEKVAADTGGKVKIEVYPSSQLGDTADVLEQAKSGANVGVIIDTGMLADYVPSMAIYTAPYVFNSRENARKFIETETFRGWDVELTKHGLRDLGCNWYQGARNFLTNIKVEKPEDLKGLRVRTMGSTVAQESMKALGAIPTSLPWSEAYGALQSQVIDSVEAQTPAIYGASLHEVTKFCAVTEHFLLFTALVISESWFQSLPDEYKAVLVKRAIEAGDYATQLTVEKEVQFNKEMESKGLTFIQVDKKPFIAASTGVYKTMGWEDLKAKIDAELGQ
ncbi:MAG: C4-dicarboxylate TRAP transporter substrate-binding protein [Synergistaceae bacterium]|jgi:tripartite ATP-independent transporter DctP family solute receptor|nr:C4-dicarboxylate TRAP transporter substrate-binding protein [Synergistaceae bacterium]